MRPSTFHHRQKYQHMVNRRYKRDLILVITAVIGCSMAIIGITMAGSQALQKLDSSPLTGIVIVASATCILFFFKYARR